MLRAFGAEARGAGCVRGARRVRHGEEEVEPSRRLGTTNARGRRGVREEDARRPRDDAGRGARAGAHEFPRLDETLEAAEGLLRGEADGLRHLPAELLRGGFLLVHVEVEVVQNLRLRRHGRLPVQAPLVLLQPRQDVHLHRVAEWVVDDRPNARAREVASSLERFLVPSETSFSDA
jgi:hypothetical protein